MKTHLVVAILSGFIAANLHAELKWQDTTLELHPNFGDQEAVGHFKYQNIGKTPIKLTSVKTSCGCTVAQSQKDEVAPGEKGEITATFHIGGRTGINVKTITVQTDDPSAQTVQLTLKAVVPEGLTLNPTFVFWKAGEEAKPKTIMAKAGKDFAAKHLTVTAENPQFSADVQPDGADTWKIVVTPKQTDHNIATRIVVKTDFPKSSPGVFYANASVAGAPTQAAAPRP